MIKYSLGVSLVAVVIYYFTLTNCAQLMVFKWYHNNTVTGNNCVDSILLNSIVSWKC